MKLVIISDTHSLHGQMYEDIPEGDVLIHCGDVCNRGTTREALDFIEWFKKQPHDTKIFIAGNHDWAFKKKSDELKHALADLELSGSEVCYLEDEGMTVEIDGQEINFWGSPWQPEFCNWAFNLPRGEALKAKWDMIPENTHVLITHGPPMTKGNVDYTVYDRVNVGCEELSKKIATLPNLLVHCFGHIHEGYGVEDFPGTPIKLINASICTLRYSPSNAPIVIEI